VWLWVLRRRSAVLQSLASALAPLLPDACARLIADSALFLAIPTPTVSPTAILTIQDKCKPDAPGDPSPDGDNPSGSTQEGLPAPNTVQPQALMPKPAGTHAEIVPLVREPTTSGEDKGLNGSVHEGGGVPVELGVQSALGGHEDVSGRRGASGVGEGSVEGNDAVEKPKRRQSGRGPSQALAQPQEQLQMNPLTLRFADEAMEAAYVAKTHGKLFMVRTQLNC
jgi:hypothetical protein